MRGLAIVPALLIFAVSLAWADHVAEWQMSTRKPETSLAGIRVGKTSIHEARKRLGEPTRAQDLTEEPVPENAGKETEYIWERDGILVIVNTLHDSGNRTAGEEIVHGVTVSGARAPKGYKTGAGVELGDDLSALIRAYGPVYLTSWRPPTAEGTTYTFIFRDETELSAGLSEEGRIVSLALLASVE